MNIVNVGYDSTNYYVIGDKPRLLVDVGWPGTLPKLLNMLKRKTITLSEIKYLLSTHYHPDHAGLAQELKNEGIRLIVLETQLTSVPILRSYIKPEHHFQDIDLSDNINMRIQESRKFLLEIGIQGEIISTPGHSDDSVTLILDEGIAFTGDLPGLMYAEDPTKQIKQSWERIRSLGVKTIYPGHGPVRSFE
jgi:endoribonuclease LACTB2